MEVNVNAEQQEFDAETDEWRDCDISDLCGLQRGFDITEATRKPGDVPVYSSSGVSYYHNKSKVKPPVVITGRKGLIGRVFFVEEPCWPHDTTLWVRDFKGNDPKFVYFYLSHFRLERFDAATSVPTLNRNNVTGIPIKLPALPQQCIIAKALSDLEELINALDQLVAKKRDLKQAAMQQILTGHRRLHEFEDKWTVKQLGDIGMFMKGRGIKKDEVISNGIPCVRYGEIYTHHNDYHYPCTFHAARRSIIS